MMMSSSKSKAKPQSADKSQSKLSSFFQKSAPAAKKEAVEAVFATQSLPILPNAPPPDLAASTPTVRKELFPRPLETSTENAVFQANEEEDSSPLVLTKASRRSQGKRKVIESEEEEDVDDEDEDWLHSESDSENESPRNGAKLPSSGRRKGQVTERSAPQSTKKARKLEKAQTFPVVTPAKRKRSAASTSSQRSSKKLPASGERSSFVTPRSETIDIDGDDTAPIALTTTTGQSITLPEGVVGRGSHEHNSFDFLQPENIRDAEGRRPDHPDYNHRTLKVPAKFLADQTPALQQWWQFKSRNMDTVLFFKVGKFYELFHMDADIGFAELNLIYMKGDKAHSGFPEVCYGKFASQLVAKGYKVARVEQTETPEMLKERNESAGRGKKDKVVAREMCSILTKGTRTFCHLDDLTLLEEHEPQGTSTSFLLAIVESPVQPSQAASDSEIHDVVAQSEFGICAIDTAIGKATLAQFQDSSQCFRLRTFIARFPPTEIVALSNGLSKAATASISFLAPEAAFEHLHSSISITEDGVVQQLEKAGYFVGADAQTKEMPVLLRAVMKAYEADGSSAPLLLAIGVAMKHLQRSMIDHEIFSQRRFVAYVPDDEEGNVMHKLICHCGEGAADDVVATGEAINREEDNHLVLTMDEVTLRNLEIFQNNYDQSVKGSLWHFINRCYSPGGRRVLKAWLTQPLFSLRHIALRREAVEELLVNLNGGLSMLQTWLKKMPDLQRLLGRIHTNGMRYKSTEHPDARAILFEANTYTARKIRDFADVLNGLDVASRAAEMLMAKYNCTSAWLSRYFPPLDGTEPRNSKAFPLQEVQELLKHYRDIFDEDQAKRDGNIKPHPGVNPDYDSALETIQALHRYLDEYLERMKKESGIRDISYYGNHKDRFQLEVPIDLVDRVPKYWKSKSQKKTHRRFWTDEIEERLSELIAAEERRDEAQGDTLRQIFARFDQHREVWDRVEHIISTLDALMSLASISSLPNYTWPTFVSRCDTQAPCLHVKGGRHPMLEQTLAQRGLGEFIPNDLSLGGQQTLSEKDAVFLPRLLLLTGPNMGGKSTLLRQTCLLTVLAQIGCKVPAQEMTLTPVDRIFTRIGASDRLFEGQSTFFVELAETSLILRAATQDSLCILDELGRGTSTYDGTAIAHAVVRHLVNVIRCRSLFSTHYHVLVEDWEIDPRVRLGHMDCIVENADASEEEVTFLYKLCDGSSPKSYGINVARMAGLPESVIALAREMSQRFAAESACSDTEKAHRRMEAVYDTIVDTVGALEQAAANGRTVDKDELLFMVQELWKRVQVWRAHQHVE